MENYYAENPGTAAAWPYNYDYSAYAAATNQQQQVPQTQSNYMQQNSAASNVATQQQAMQPGAMDPYQAQYYYAQQQQQQYYQPTVNYGIPPPPPPPPPPKKNQLSPLCSPNTSEPSSSPPDSSATPTPVPQQSQQSPYLMSVSIPPMPPTFPWVTSSMYAPFAETASSASSSSNPNDSLPFVPVVMPEDRLKTMTQNIQGQVDSFNKKPLNWSQDLIDPKLPRALKDMFQPLYCKLCILTLTSPIVAQDHYKGKKHKRKIEVWLEENEPTAMPTATMQNSQGQPQKGYQNGSYPTAGPPAQQTNRGNFHQPARNMPQKRNLSADSQGRQNPRAPLPYDHSDRQNTNSANSDNLLSGANAVPLGSCSWTTSPPISQQPLPLMSVSLGGPPFQGQNRSRSNSSEPGITHSGGRERGGGGAFQSNNNNKRVQMPNVASDPPAKKERKDSSGTGGNFDYCHFCDVTLSSQINADQHYAGKRHRENVGDARQTGNFDDMGRNFGIGKAFRAKSDKTTTSNPSNTAPGPQN